MFLWSVHFPSTLNAIDACVFYKCALLREVILPDGIQSIRDGAFARCKSLESIALPSTLNVIGSKAFWDCVPLRAVELRGGIQIILRKAFRGCDLLDYIRVPCRALVITGNRGGQNFSLARDGFTPQVSTKKLVIASECFNSIRPTEMPSMETAIMRIIGEEIMQSAEAWYEDSNYDKWEEKCQQLRALMAPYEKRHKNEIASFLELRLWKADMEKLGNDTDARTRAECRPARGVEVIQDNVLSFLHFL